MEDKKKKRLKIIRIVIQAVILLSIIGVCIYGIIELMPIFNRLKDDTEYQQEIITQLQSFGSFSWIILIGISVLQTVLAVIPAGPIVIITGMMYNPAVAVIITLVGQTLGALVVILLVKAFGYTFLALFIDPEQPKKFKISDDSKKCGVLMFSYLLIPLLPKDPIAFIVPFTKVKIWVFLLINVVARTPMTIVSVLFGNSLVSGNMTIAIVIGCISALLALLCFIFNKRIVNFIDKITSKKKGEVIE